LAPAGGFINHRRRKTAKTHRIKAKTNLDQAAGSGAVATGAIGGFLLRFMAQLRKLTARQLL